MHLYSCHKYAGVLSVWAGLGGLPRSLTSKPESGRQWSVRMPIRCRVAADILAVAQRKGVAVMSGFQSKLEREVLDFLLRGECGIICVLARPIYKVVPEVYREAFDEGRVLFISHNRYSSSMTNRRMCQQRNEYIATTASKLVLASVTPQSSLYPFSQLEKSVTLL